jgi:predicted amidohydrolase YtcJ
LLGAGIGVGASADAPFGPLDPWLAMETAMTRTTNTGALVGPGERIDAALALSMWLSSANNPAGLSRTVAVGAPARLCLIDRPLADALARPAEVRVVRTLALTEEDEDETCA